MTSKRMSGGQDCQYWGRLHFIECLLGSCASKPEQLLLLLHFVSHSGCKRLEPEVLEQAKKKSGVPESILLEPTRLELIEKVE